MKRPVFLTLVFVSPFALSQDDGGSIRGTITGPEGERIPYVWVRVVDADDETELRRTETTADGAYRLGRLAAGDYVVEISPPGDAYVRQKSEELTVVSGTETVYDARLEEGVSFNTVGDDPGVIASAIRSVSQIPDEPPPRLVDSKPDFSGVWMLASDPFPVEPDPLPWAQQLFEERIANEGRDHPHNDCLPGGPPIPGAVPPFMTKLVHKESLLVILFEDYPGFRQIFVDGRDHPEYVDPSWVGHSIAHWEGDTLVVDTIGFNDRGWVKLWPRSEDLRITERYTRPEFGRIEIEVTYDDPRVFVKPWKEVLSMHLAPQEALIEYVCENNKW
jgi:hypothetical protein